MGTRVTINSPSTYRDNQWHHVVATLGADGMKLYVDGNQVAANANVKKAQVYRGYWRVGGDNLSSWPSTPNREAITANLDEVAVYPQALTLGHVRAHYLASGRSTVFPNINPTAAFTNTTHYLTATMDGTGSSDDDGTIASYAWDFGDGNTGTGATVPHLYANAGTYTVALTVTDNRGGTNTVTHPVTVVDPPPNILPVASFTAGTTYRTVNFASTSTDEDGTIATHAWDFGDGTTGNGASVSHTYAGPGTYNVTLSVTDNRGGPATVTSGVTITDQYAADTFERTVANGLGTADNGGAVDALRRGRELLGQQRRRQDHGRRQRQPLGLSHVGPTDRRRHEGDRRTRPGFDRRWRVRVADRPARVERQRLPAQAPLSGGWIGRGVPGANRRWRGNRRLVGDTARLDREPG